MKRIDIRAISGEDPHRIQQVYRYMIENNSDAKDADKNIRAVGANLWSIWPEDKKYMLNHYKDLLTACYKYQLNRAYALGVLTAYKMFLGLPYERNTNSEEVLLDEYTMDGSRAYALHNDPLTKCFYDICEMAEGYVGAAEALDDWGEWAVRILIYLLDYQFAFGVEYGLDLCGIIDAEYGGLKEDLEYIAGIYKLVHLDNP